MAICNHDMDAVSYQSSLDSVFFSSFNKPSKLKRTTVDEEILLHKLDAAKLMARLALLEE